MLRSLEPVDASLLLENFQTSNHRPVESICVLRLSTKIHIPTTAFIGVISEVSLQRRIFNSMIDTEMAQSQKKS